MKTKNVRESFKYALDGVKYAFETERNIRIHFAAAIVVLILSFILDIKGLDLALIIFAISLVIMAEMINTAVESVVDLVCQDRHPLAAIAKNVAAGAVLVTALNAIIVGILILSKYILP